MKYQYSPRLARGVHETRRDLFELERWHAPPEAEGPRLHRPWIVGILCYEPAMLATEYVSMAGLGIRDHNGIKEVVFASVQPWRGP